MEVNTRESGPNPAANYLVGHVKRSLWSGSYIGLMGIDKTSGNPNDSYNQTYGADASGLLAQFGGERICSGNQIAGCSIRAEQCRDRG
jgi:hypothetical protein